MSVAARLVGWDDLGMAEIDALARKDASAGTIPLLLLIDGEGLRVVSPFDAETTANLLVGAGVAINRGRMN